MAKQRDRSPLAQLRRKLELALDGDAQILVGPWTGEVGYELLYWIPFVQWVVQTIPGVSERMVILSRGSVSSWYANISDRYLELFDLMEPDEIDIRRRAVIEEEADIDLRRVLKRRHRYIVGVKQRRESSVDDILLERAKDALQLDHYAFLAPKAVYGLISLLKKVSIAYRSPAAAEAFLGKPMLRAAVPRTPDGLPERYAAVRVYAGGGSPRRPNVIERLRAVIEALAGLMPVVLIEPRLKLDHHSDFVFPSLDVHRIADLEPKTNLAVQTGVVAGADLLVGSYGGTSYLGPYLGVPTVALLMQPAASPAVGELHLTMARRLFALPGFADYLVLGPEWQERAPQLASIVERLGGMGVE